MDHGRLPPNTCPFPVTAYRIPHTALRAAWAIRTDSDIIFPIPSILYSLRYSIKLVAYHVGNMTLPDLAITYFMLGVCLFKPKLPRYSSPSSITCHQDRELTTSSSTVSIMISIYISSCTMRPCALLIVHTYPRASFHNTES